jgi:hypothetical protein
MKRKITLMLFAAASVFSMNSQVVLSEDFTEPFNPATSGWEIINNSAPQGTVSWAQGNQTGGNGTTVAFNGNTDDFYMADFMSIPLNSAGGISAFLITPTVTIYNGAVLQFATRTVAQTAPNFFPDRMQVLMSQTGNTVIPTGTTSVGSFTDILLDINPNLTLNTSSVVAGNSVNGYPATWAIYNLTISGVTGSVTGRFAFRYFVNNGGSAGANSRLVALDAVRYTLPCGITVPSYTICSGGSATLNAVGGSSAYTYTWLPSTTNNSFVAVSPGATTTYSLQYSNGTVTCPIVESTVTIGSQLSIDLAASSNTVCSGTSVSISAQSAATTYSWNTGATTAAITVTPNATTVYTVAGITGSLPFPTCYGANTIQITVNASPSVAVAISPSVLCASQGSVTITASGADSYSYPNLASNDNPLSFGTPTAGVWNLQINGINNNGCSVSGVIVFTVEPTPTVTVTRSSPTLCTTHVATLTGNGADTYVWTGANPSTSNPMTYSSSTAGTKNFIVTGTDLAGCTGTAAISINVSVCNLVGLNALSANGETAIFPNPFTNEIHINDLDGQVIIYNAIGQVVINTPIRLSETINTSDLPKGSYLVKAYNTNGELVKTVKLIKN